MDAGFLGDEAGSLGAAIKSKKGRVLEVLYKCRVSMSSQKCSLYRPIYTTADLTEEF